MARRAHLCIVGPRECRNFHQNLRLPDERARTRNRSRARCSTRGYEAAANELEADVVLFNTCSVRDMAEQKALGKMGMLGRMREAAGRTWSSVFSAAWRRRAARNCSQLMPHVDLVVGTQKFHRVADYVEELRARKRAATDRADQPGRAMDDPRFSIVNIGGRGAARRKRSGNMRCGARQATAFVSIMQGCNMHCTFASCRGRAAPSAAERIARDRSGSARVGRRAE